MVKKLKLILLVFSGTLMVFFFQNCSGQLQSMSYSGASQSSLIIDNNDIPAETSSPASVPNVPRPSILSENYKLIFSDEFNGTALDYMKWNTQYIWGPELIINNEEQFYVDTKNNLQFGYSPFQVKDGYLHITAGKTSETLLSTAKNQPYLSGVITTWDSLRTKYGYFEVSAKIAKGKGMWSAFWLLHVDQVLDRPEIDIMESLGHETNVLHFNYHYREKSGEEWRVTKAPAGYSKGPDYSADFFRYAVKWEPNLIVWYINEVEVHRFSSEKVSDQDMYILLNLAVGGDWPGGPNAETQFPNSYEIDYVRVYQK